MAFLYVQSDEPNRWYSAQPWQEKMVSSDSLFPRNMKNVVVRSPMKDLFSDNFPNFTVNSSVYDSTEDIRLAERLLAKISTPEGFMKTDASVEVSQETTGRLSRRQRRRQRADNNRSVESRTKVADGGQVPVDNVAKPEGLLTDSLQLVSKETSVNPTDESVKIENPKTPQNQATASETVAPSSWSSLFSGMFVRADSATVDPPHETLTPAVDQAEKIKELIPLLENAVEYCYGNDDYDIWRLYSGTCRLLEKLKGGSPRLLSDGFICNLRTGTTRIYLETSLTHAEVEAMYSHNGTTTLSPSTLASINLFA